MHRWPAVLAWGVAWGLALHASRVLLAARDAAVRAEWLWGSMLGPSLAITVSCALAAAVGFPALNRVSGFVAGCASLVLLQVTLLVDTALASILVLRVGLAALIIAGFGAMLVGPRASLSVRLASALILGYGLGVPLSVVHFVPGLWIGGSEPGLALAAIPFALAAASTAPPS